MLWTIVATKDGFEKSFDAVLQNGTFAEAVAALRANPGFKDWGYVESYPARQGGAIAA